MLVRARLGRGMGVRGGWVCGGVGSAALGGGVWGVRGSLAKRKNPNPRDEEFLFSRNLDDELRKHGA